MSRFGAYDMIGNVTEWVAEWHLAGRPTAAPFPDGQNVTPWPTGFSSDNGDTTTNVDGRSWWNSAWRNGLPAALCRGGAYSGGGTARAFHFELDASPSHWDGGRGFRCCIGGG